MKEQLNLKELAAQITERASRKEDFIADTRDLAMSPDAKELAVTAGTATSYKITDLAHRQISERLNIPGQFYNRLRADEPDLIAHTVNELFKRKPEARMVRTLDGSARAFLSDKYQRMDDDAFASVVLPIIGERRGEVVSCAIEPERTHIKFISPRHQRDVQVGDPVQFGIAFSNSEVGLGRIEGALLVYRLVCKNGMISADDAWGTSHVGRRQGKERNLREVFKLDTIAADGKATILKLRDFADQMLTDSFIDQYVERVRGLTEAKIAKPQQAVERLAKAHGFNDTEKESVLAHLIEGGDLSAWGLLNAVTAAAQDEGLTYTRATEMERIGGKIVNLTRADYEALEAA